MDKEKAWEQFTKTGSVNDYLNYATVTQNSETICTNRVGENLNNADNNRCSSNQN